MKTDSELIANIALTLIPKFTYKHFSFLLEKCGSAENIFNEPKRLLYAVPRITDEIVNNLTEKTTIVEAEKELLFTKKHSIQIYLYHSSIYPAYLKEIEDPPILLYGKGNIDFSKQSLSIVGTRHPTSYGKKQCEDLVTSIAQKGYDINIVSGLASGIDGYAHTTALRQQLQTIAVLGHGLDTLYPLQHLKLSEAIVTQGGLLTEFPSGTQLLGKNFLQRNRIIAGLSQGTVVVESAFRGGALNTACLALNYNRDVMAFPGRVEDKISAGCNNLIKTQRATLVTGFDDVEVILNWQSSKSEKKKSRSMPLLPKDLSPKQETILRLLLENEHLHVDHLANKANLSMAEINTSLLELEMQNIIISLPGKKYKLA